MEPITIAIIVVGIVVAIIIAAVVIFRRPDVQTPAALKELEDKFNARFRGVDDRLHATALAVPAPAQVPAPAPLPASTPTAPVAAAPSPSSPTDAYRYTATEAVERDARNARDAANARAADAGAANWRPGYDLDEWPNRLNPAQPADTYQRFTFTGKAGKVAALRLMPDTDMGAGGEWTAYLSKGGVIVNAPTPYGRADFAEPLYTVEAGAYEFFVKNERAGGVRIQFQLQ